MRSEKELSNVILGNPTKLRSIAVTLFVGAWLFFGFGALADVTIRFHTDRPGYVSLNVYRPDGVVARQLLTAGWFEAGDHDVVWDELGGASDAHAGQSLPAGDYTWRAVFHEGLGLKLRGWACNEGAKPWESADGRGDWGGDRGTPSAVAADDERVYLGWSLDDSGRAVVACDPGGKALWSERRAGTAGCKALATDDGLVYVLGGAEGDDAAGGAVHRLRAADGASAPWPNDLVDLKITSLWPADGQSKPKCADAMAVRNGHIYLSFTAAQFMAILDAKTGAYLETVVGAPPGAVDATPTKTDLPSNPGVLADADFAITILNGSVLGKLLFAHDPLWIVGSDMTILEHKERITALTMLGDGAKFHRQDVFLGIGEPFHQVQARPILHPEGFTWIAGRSGGRSLLGPWQADGLRDIRAVALDGTGELWVAEGDAVPKRFSVWTTDGTNGKLAREFFGSADAGARGGAIHPGDPNLMLGQGCEWRFDPKTGHASCLGVITREGMDRARFCVGPGGRVYLAVSHAQNGPVSFYERLGDGDYRMRARIFQADAAMKEVSPSAPDAKSTQTVLWADENGDGERQPGELHAVPGDLQFSKAGLSVTPELALCGMHPRRGQRGFRWKVNGWTACGAPLYDLAHPEALPAFGECSGDGKFLLQPSAVEASETGFVCWDIARGKARWTYPVNSASADSRKAQNVSIAGKCQVVGCVNLPAPIGNAWVIASQAGDWHLLTEDGFYLSRLFESNSEKVKWPDTANPGAEMSHVPAFQGSAVFGGSVTQGKDGKVYLQAGKTAFWNLEVTGLDTVRALGGGNVSLRPR